MNLENIMLIERSRSLKTTFVWFHLYEMSRIGEFTETQSRLVVARHLGMKAIEVTSSEYGLGDECSKII